MRVDRRGLTRVMVGRSTELRRLLALVPSGVQDSVAPDRDVGPQVALITGEAGIGKSRLVAELRAAVPQGTSILVGRTGTGPPGRPYAVLVDAAEPMVASWSAVPGVLSGREESVRLLLSAVAPDLRMSGEREFGQDEILRAAVDLVHHLAPPPSLVIFEDLHEADPESIGLFRRLALTGSESAALVGTYRPEDVGASHALALALADLERRRSIIQIPLSRLTRSSVGELVSTVYSRQVSWHVADALHQRTAGNPFFVEEVLIAAGEADPERLRAITLPRTVTDVVARNLAALGDLERSVVDTAAVLGSRFSFDLLRAVVGTTEPVLIAVLRRLVTGDLLSEEQPDVFVFRHALTQEVVAGHLLGRERRRIHERALRLMGELASDDFAAMAYHAAGADRPDEVIVNAARGSRSYLRLGLVHEALRLAELGLAEDGTDLELRRVASQAAWQIGLLDLARRHGVQWRELAAHTGDRTAEGAALRHLARVEWEAGNPPAGVACAEQALALAEQGEPDADLALAMVLMSEVRMLSLSWEPASAPSGRSDAAAAVDWADKALALADRLGYGEVRPRALVNRGTALVCMAGGVAEGMAVLEQARQEAVERGDDWNHMRALRNLICKGLEIWPADRIQAALDEQRTAGHRIGREAHADHNWAQAAADLSIIRGDVEGARNHLAEGRRQSPELRGMERFRYVATEIGLALEQGGLADAGSQLARAKSAGEWTADFEALAAELTAFEGDPHGATERLLLATGVAGPGSLSDERRLPVLTAAITLLRHGAEPASIRAVVESLDRIWPAWPDHPVARRRHVEAALLEAEGRYAEAMATYEEALSDPAGHRPAYLVADAEQGVARCLLVVGRTNEARVRAERATILLGQWPGWRATQAAALARRCGLASGLRSRRGTEPLTVREREVAALLTEGLTNGEIARRLFISTKTASAHVSHILAKMGMATRAEVAAWATREGLGAT